MRICGVDPGLQITGYGVIEVTRDETRVLDAGTVRTDRGAELSVRLGQIYSDLCAVLEEHDPGVLAVENVYSHYTFSKAEKNYALADTIRERLVDQGVTLEDCPDGTRWRVS